MIQGGGQKKDVVAAGFVDVARPSLPERVCAETTVILDVRLLKRILDDVSSHVPRQRFEYPGKVI